MSAEILQALIAVNIAAAGAVLIVLILRGALRRGFGARVAYAAWLLVPFSGLAALLPARLESLPMAAAPVRPLAEATVTALATGTSAIPILILLAWGIGAGALLLHTGLTQVRTVRLLGEVTEMGATLRAAHLSVGPAVLGIRKPRIITPAGFEDRFAPLERELILAHEVAHIAGHDTRINACAELLRCLCWFNPLIHLAAQQMRVDQELACDAAVIARFPKARRSYAEALLKSQTAAAPLPLGCYWPQRSSQALKERLTMLTMKSPGRGRSLGGAALVTLLGLGASYAAWATEPQDVLIAAAQPIGPQLQTAPLPAAKEAELAGQPKPTRRIELKSRTPGSPTTEGVVRVGPATSPEGLQREALLAAIEKAPPGYKHYFVACHDEDGKPTCSVDGTETKLPLPPLPEGAELRTFQLRAPAPAAAP